MKYYNVIDEQILKDNKTNFIISNVLSIILFIIGLIMLLSIENGIYILAVYSIIDIILLLDCHSTYRKYQVKVKLNDSIIEVFIRGKYKRQFNIKQYNVMCKDVAITRKYRYQKQYISPCLIVYKNIELYDLMEYSSYWNEDNILIIQNKELINKVLKLKELN